VDAPDEASEVVFVYFPLLGILCKVFSDVDVIQPRAEGDHVLNGSGALLAEVEASDLKLLQALEALSSQKSLAQVLQR